MPNRLINESSPYLLQHAHNPVDWYPWGEEALQRAREEDKPILLSIGYSACHWCHVMERESFEDPQTAEIMNRYFVNIKVDREERPDLDQVYMEAVQAMTGQGGWPLNVFLTPDGVPFFGGTYFPPVDRLGMSSFRRVLLAVAEAWRSRRQEVAAAASDIRRSLQQQAEAFSRPLLPLATDLLDQAYRALEASFDPPNGGFGGAPKFPQPMVLDFLLRYYWRSGQSRAREMVVHTLARMAAGGIYDHLGGGFHRYSVDARWLVPHFEKMLYDNAQLARLYLHAYLATGEESFRQVVEETLDYVLRDMSHDEGGFYSTQDADSEGEEGKYYLWSRDEIVQVLGADAADLFCRYYGVTEHGNFEGRNILHAQGQLAGLAGAVGMLENDFKDLLARWRAQLLEKRAQRVPPVRDEKIIASWNGLMLVALAEAGASLGRPDYVLAAERSASFLLQRLWRNGRLMRVFKDGRSRIAGYLEDYANLADGLVALYEATFDWRWLEAAAQMLDTAVDLFWDSERKSFYDTSHEHEQLVVRPKHVYDNATPSGTSVVTHLLLRMAVFLGEERYRAMADSVLRTLAPLMARYPTAFGRLLACLDFYLASPVEIAVIGDRTSADTQALLKVIFRRYLPNRVVGLAAKAEEADRLPLLRGRTMLGGKPTAYVCQDYVCQRPVSEPEELEAQLAQKRS